MTMNRAAFYAAVRPNPFGGTLKPAQFAGLEAIFDAAPAGFPLEHLAYALATTFRETGGTMQPVHELGGNAYLSKYDTGKLAAALGNTPAADGDGQLYCGRGYVQLTGRRNYAVAGPKVGVDLIAHPEKAMDPAIAARVMFVGMTEGWFTKHKLSDYFGPGRSDPVNARRIINGVDHADEIAGRFRRFSDALKAAGYAPGPAPAAAPSPAPAAPPPVKSGSPAAPAPKVASGGLFSWLNAALSRKP